MVPEEGKYTPEVEYALTKKEDTSKKKVKFPFVMNEKAKAAFRSESGMRMAIELVTRVLVESAANQSNPWITLLKEHPELREFSKVLVYTNATETLDIRKKD